MLLNCQTFFGFVKTVLAQIVFLVKETRITPISSSLINFVVCMHHDNGQIGINKPEESHSWLQKFRLCVGWCAVCWDNCRVLQDGVGRGEEKEKRGERGRSEVVEGWRGTRAALELW